MQPHRPRKRFGQNFLHDPRILDQIVAAIAPRADDAMVEIGPGQGALTWRLLRHLARLTVVEIDRDLVAALRAAPEGADRLDVREADALRFDFAALDTDTRPLRVVGNLPYNISTPLLFHLLEAAASIQDMHFLLQREVVDRLAAAPGSAHYGRLSVMVQYRCTVEKLFEVGPGAFKPAPKVHSAIVRLRPRPRPVIEALDTALLAQVVRQAFSQRRKILSGSLRGLAEATDFAAASIDPGLRPERLEITEFVRLSNNIAARNGR
ncbi:MAG: 16S rRNA (adenine(1518)-N(6)/adenine(1519)-N(6))-dimethyltransferase RsmA [Thiotrichales bacterium]